MGVGKGKQTNEQKRSPKATSTHPEEHCTPLGKGRNRQGMVLRTPATITETGNRIPPSTLPRNRFQTGTPFTLQKFYKKYTGTTGMKKECLQKTRKKTTNNKRNV